MRPEDREIVSSIVRDAGNFNEAEVDCALELIDVYLNDAGQNDYRILVLENDQSFVRAYACWGPTPLTRGTYDLYWIATHSKYRGLGYGQALMREVERCVAGESGRLLVVETSSRESYSNTIRFYRNLGYQQTSGIRDFYDVGDDKIIFVKRLSR